MNQATQALHKQDGVGIAPSYNHDLNVGDTFVELYPDIAEALKDERLWRLFTTYEVLSRKYKGRFQTLGFWSLVLGSLPLFVASFRLALGETMFTRIPAIAAIAGISGTLSVILMLVIRRRRYRVLWCQTVFCRERLREWHFQQFLDGAFICLLKTDRNAYLRARDFRWNSLLQNLQDGYGLMEEYISYSSKETNYFVTPSEYPDKDVAQSVFAALRILRFEHQLRYSTRKRGIDGEPTGLALRERVTISESVASMALAGAVFTSAVALSVWIGALFDHAKSITIFSPAVSRILDGTAVGLAVLSATSRAYRAGFTLPDESESYEEYCDRIREAKAIFTVSNDQNEKLRQLEVLEEESAAELRRFLRMKTRATFIS